MGNRNHGIVPERVGDGQPESLDIAPGNIVVIREGSSYSWGRFLHATVKSASPKLLKLEKTSSMWCPRQVRREQVVAIAATKEQAEQLCQSLTGIRGENDRRRKIADEARVAAVAAADAASDKQMGALLSRLNKEQAA